MTKRHPNTILMVSECRFFVSPQERFLGTLRFIIAYASFPNSVTLRFADYMGRFCLLLESA
nr:MAG TPA: hypothetical protein [Caudoviricetes sp.]